jgi:hypothetical protein
MARRLQRRSAEHFERLEREVDMKTLSLLIVLLGASVASANPYTFHGPWHTTANRQLVGTQTAVIERVSLEEWKGHFYGTWHGADFSYTVTFSGPPDALRGTAVVDGTPYKWTGSINQKKLRGKFHGGYTGSFDMDRRE